MYRILRMLMAKPGKMPKEQTDIVSDGFVFRVTVQDDREFDWFKNMTVIVYKAEASSPPGGTHQDDVAVASKSQMTAIEKHQLTSTDSSSRAEKKQKLCHEKSPSGTKTDNMEEEAAKNLPDLVDGVVDDEDSDNDDDRIDARCSVDNTDSDMEHLDEYEDLDSSEWESEEEDSTNSIGHCFARLISRNAIRADFWKEMEEPSQDTMALAFDLFDRYGFLRPEVISGPSSGSGMWSFEVNQGDFLQVETVTVEEGYRRQGLAEKMLEHLHGKAIGLQEYLAFSFAWPTQLNSRLFDTLSKDERQAKWTEGHNAAVGLFRKTGYCRVGTTNWFAYAFDPNHPSRCKPREEDYDPTSLNLSRLDKFLEQLEQSRTRRPFGTGMLILSDDFRGHSDDEVKAVFELRGIAMPPANSVTFLRTKFGCTCGQCMGGFISPTMKYTLFHQAEMAYDTHEELGQLLRDCDVNLDSDEESFYFMPSLEFLPKSIRPYLKSNKSVAEGYRTMFQHISVCLAKDIVPNIENLLRVALASSDWPPSTKNFLEKGNPREATAAVLKALIATSRNQDIKAGDGMFMEGFDELPPETHHNYLAFKKLKDDKEIAEAKPCRNDSEFGFVQGMLLQG